MKVHYYKEDIKEICLHNHLTVDEIFAQVKEKHPSVGRSTIYRNVEEMVKDGSLKKLCGIGSKALYEATKVAHAHIIDSKTGEVRDLELSDLDLKLPENFEMKDLDIKIFGQFKTQ